MEIYFSTDVETDGPIPGRNSMLSIGSAAFTPDGDLIGTFSANLHTLPNAFGDMKTMRWWMNQPKAWEATQQNMRDPQDVMVEFSSWVKSTAGKNVPVFVGYPATFDFMFVYWYLIRFTDKSPFGFQALDIKTFAMAHLKGEFKSTVKKNMPKRWFSKSNKHTHVAVDDAIEQGHLFINILKESRK